MKHPSLLERLFGPKVKPANTRPFQSAPFSGGQVARPRFRPLQQLQAAEALELGKDAKSDRSLAYDFQDLHGAHYLCGAATGKGKSRLVSGLIMQHCRRLARHGEPGVVLLDPKSETVDLVQRQLAQELPSWPPAEQERLLASLLVIAPCRRGRALTPLQLLRASGTEAESCAAEVSEALVQGVEADMGVLQEVVLGNILALAIESREDWSLVEIPQLLADEERLKQMAALSQLAGPKAYVLSGRFGREATKRISGIQGRIEKLLRIKRLRLALAAPGLLDLGQAFRGRITLIDLGSDFAADDATRIVGRILFSRLVSALFSARQASLKPTLLVCEEFPDLLGRGLGAKAERIFSQARSRGTSCMVLFQAPAQLQKDGLLRVLQANARITLLGQMPTSEARAFEELLPHTGAVPRLLQPGEVLPKTLYLSSAEERTFWLQKIGKLPKGTFFFSDRDRRDKTSFIKARYFDPPTWGELERTVPHHFLERVRKGSTFVSTEEAKQSYEQRLARFSTPPPSRGSAGGTGSSPVALPRKRSRRKKGRMP